MDKNEILQGLQAIYQDYDSERQDPDNAQYTAAYTYGMQIVSAAYNFISNSDPVTEDEGIRLSEVDAYNIYSILAEYAADKGMEDTLIFGDRAVSVDRLISSLNLGQVQSQAIESENTDNNAVSRPAEAEDVPQENASNDVEVAIVISSDSTEQTQKNIDISAIMGDNDLLSDDNLLNSLS